jgi:hypothetical protein
MLTSFAAIPANGCSSPSSPDANSSPSGTNPPAKENPMLIDPQIMMNDQVIKVTILMTGTGLLNPIPYVTGFVQHLTMADPSALLLSVGRSDMHEGHDNFRMNTRSGRYGAAYNMVGLCCFNEELLLLPKNPTEAKLQATSTRGESTEPT